VSYLVEMPIGDEQSGSVVVEVRADELTTGELELAASDPAHLVVRARQSFRDAVAAVRPALSAVVGELRQLAADEVEVEVGLKVGTSAGIVIAQGTTEVNFAVRLKWTKPQR
jgi:hypothetical protein